MTLRDYGEIRAPVGSLPVPTARQLTIAGIPRPCITTSAAAHTNTGHMVHHSCTRGSSRRSRGCIRDKLAVVSKKVVLVEPGDGGLAGECGVRSMDVVGVRPPRQRVCSFR